MEEKGQKVVAVTGATGAIGKAIALMIAERPSYEVVLLCRNEKKAKQTVDEIQRQSSNLKVRFELLDLSRQQSIQELRNRWQGRLDILINNAAITPRSRQETPEGIELQFATNVLGYFWMIKAFEDLLKQYAPTRIINVASYWAGDLDINDLEFKRRPYNNNVAYRQSKQANRILTVAFAEKLKPLGITVNACHPGEVNSALSNNLGFGGHESPRLGAETPVWLALESVGKDYTGQYFEYKQLRTCPFAKDRKTLEKLYDICESYTK